MLKSLFKTFSIKRFDFLLVAMIVSLNIFGIVAIGSASPDLQPRQIQGMIFSLVIMVFVSMLDYTQVLRFYWLYYAINIVFLGLVLSPLGSTGGGAQRWINLAGIRFQPSEAAKILLILFFAKFIMRYKNRMKTFVCVAACILLVLVPILMIYEQPDLSTSIMIGLIFASMMFIGGLSYKVVITVLAVTIPSVVIFINLVIQEGSTILESYQRERILAWLHPEDYETTTAYQTMNSIMAIGSGQLTGKGYNANGFSSLLSGGYISESQTDFIFTVVGEEFGFIGSCAVVILLALISIKILLIARTAKDFSGSIICAGVGAWIGLQGFLNIGVVTGVLPNTGIPLPFVSYGLTSLASLYMGVGFVLNVRMNK